MRRKIKRLYPLFLAIFILGVGLFLARSNFFQIKSITCELDQYPCPLIYEPVLVSLHNQNILSLSSGSVIKQLQALDSSLDKINLRRVLPGKIYLKLTRRQALARIEMTEGLDFTATISGIFNGTVFFLDKNGEFFTDQIDSYHQIPVVSVPADKVISLGRSDLSESIFRLIMALSEYFVSVEKIIWLPPSTSVLQIVNGPYVVINLEKDISATIASLQYILSGFKIDEVLPVKIDLRFDKPILNY